jgi:hypothetical protein
VFCGTDIPDEIISEVIAVGSLGRSAVNRPLALAGGALPQGEACQRYDGRLTNAPFSYVAPK